ncbi:RNA polymerase sigma factor, partial [Candidatus Saccharibacteria bacterium]|nr:RNA polymerase sigma factor [Candidatus Saccharibacteria bacterium]
MGLQPDLADEQIVQLVISGNKEKFGDIMERYEPKLMRYVVYLAHDEPMATDIVQETFIKSYKNLKSYNPKYKFSSWIYRIAHNEAMNAVKRDKNIVNGLEIDELKEATYESTV